LVVDALIELGLRRADDHALILVKFPRIAGGGSAVLLGAVAEMVASGVSSRTLAGLTVHRRCWLMERLDMASSFARLVPETWTSHTLSFTE
jgi:hypothetical protein